MSLPQILTLIVFSLMFGWALYNLPALLVGARQVRRRKVDEHDRRMDNRDLPFFSLIVPMKQEEPVARRILDALTKMDYPSYKYEIIVVDDASVDETFIICKEFESLYPDRVRYFRRDASSGKPSALNYGLKFARGEIVGVFDADNMPEGDVLLKTARYFEEDGAVAVQGLLSSTNPEENMLTKIIHLEDKVYRHVLMLGKDRLGLFVPLAGTCQFVRRSVLDELGGWSGDALAEDMELSARLTMKGYSIKFASDVQCRQENASTFKQFFSQRTRWFRGWMELAFKYGNLLKSLDKISLDAEASFAGPFMMLLVLATYVYSVYALVFPFKLDLFTNVLTQLISGLTVLTLFIIGIKLAYATKPRRISNVKWLPFIYMYWTAQVFVAFYAFMQIIFRRPRKWTKTSRTGAITEPFE